MLCAITRQVSAAISGCELTHLERLAIDFPRAREQHVAYERALETCGARILRARPEENMPDGVFVEDTAVVLPEAAVMMRPGAESRRGEVAGVEEILGRYRSLARIAAPGTIDGGDVLVLDKRIFVGKSSRTNDAGIEQLRAFVRQFGYTVDAVAVGGCLHLKSAVTCAAEQAILTNPAWIDPSLFRANEIIEVHPAEPYAANVLRIGNRLLFPDHFPRTRDRLLQRGLDVLAVPSDELAKAEGAVTCCSILFEA